MFKRSSLVLWVYGAFLLLGGFMGHLKSSRVSLIAGTLSAIVIIIAAIATSRQKFWGIIVGLAASSLLFAFFLYRFLLAYKFMPGGLMSLLSLGVFCFLIKSCKKAKKLV